jgi:small-conductance mechanosensitive channel
MDRVWDLVQPVLAVILAAAGAWITALAVGWLVGRAGRRTKDPFWSGLRHRCRRPFRVTLVAAAVFFALPYERIGSATADVLRHVLTVVLIASVSWLVIALSGVAEDVLAAHIDVDVSDNRRARRMRTQIAVLRRVFAAGVVFIALAAELMTFPRMRALGASFLASAGLLSIVAGLAAQATLANLLAGLQIATTDPIRIDDVVVVEGEWGRIEDITLTYVVVRTWDNRRLILPVSYFTTRVFQNWTRHESRVLGSVTLHVDFTTPVEELRTELHRLVHESPLWDGRDWVLQVIDTTPSTMVVRGLMSSGDAPTNWDLRCEVREGLVAFLQAHYPYALPNVRVEPLHDGRVPPPYPEPEDRRERVGATASNQVHGGAG